MSHGILMIVFVVILVTFIRDIRRGASRDYHLAIASVVIAMIAALIEMVSVYFVVSLLLAQVW